VFSAPDGTGVVPPLFTRELNKENTTLEDALRPKESSRELPRDFVPLRFPRTEDVVPDTVTLDVLETNQVFSAPDGTGVVPPLFTREPNKENTTLELVVRLREL